MAAILSQMDRPVFERSLLLSFDDVVVDRTGHVPGPDRLRLMRLFRALGGALAVFAHHDVATLDRALGLPDLPLIGRGGGEARLTRGLAPTRDRPVETLLGTPPFAGRPLLLLGERGAESALWDAVGRHGGICSAGAAVRQTLAAWLERLGPDPADRRAAA